MKLYGSAPSPYVRRIRLWLTDTNYEFVNINIYEGTGRDLLKQKNPALKVPVLEDGERMIFDSGVIFRYLQNKFGAPALTWEQENTLTLIDAANDSLVALMMLKRSNIEQNRDLMIVRLQVERLEMVMDDLDSRVENGEFAQWDYLTISLYCLLDWMCFRELWDISAYQSLKAFWQQHSLNSKTMATDPRR